ncbi:MAG: hypothetical protein MZV63_11250 [Marinilabiliales bacterium]|nr:hypothetical protein [Marinilabiliales bacterium]
MDVLFGRNYITAEEKRPVVVRNSPFASMSAVVIFPYCVSMLLSTLTPCSSRSDWQVRTDYDYHGNKRQEQGQCQDPQPWPVSQQQDGNYC